MNIQKFKFDDVEIEFDLRCGKNVMVNASEMLSAFPNKRMNDFVVNQNTKDFILECLNNGNSRYLGVENREDLIISKQNSGTWMHRVLALKFAAWLNPAFELWVYLTIDKLLFKFANEIEESINETVSLTRRKEDLTNKLANRYPEFVELLNVEQSLMRSRVRRRNATKNKFREKFQDLFTNHPEESDVN